MSTSTTAKRLRDKVRIAPIRDRDELTTLVIATAELTIERDRTAATRDARISEVADGFNIQLDQLDEAITTNVKRMKAWAIAHRQPAFGKAQSIEVAGHELSFRKGSGKVAYAAGVKAGDALESLLAAEDETAIDRYAKVNVSLDKNAILKAWRESTEARAFLTALGITVLVEEDFRFTPNREDREAHSAGPATSE